MKPFSVMSIRQKKVKESLTVAKARLEKVFLP